MGEAQPSSFIRRSEWCKSETIVRHSAGVVNVWSCQYFAGDIHSVMVDTHPPVVKRGVENLYKF